MAETRTVICWIVALEERLGAETTGKS